MNTILIAEDIKAIAKAIGAIALVIKTIGVGIGVVFQDRQGELAGEADA